MPVESNGVRWPALLLVGPTGSGKTPLGLLMGEEGLAGRQCLHFDFGEALRKAANGHPCGLTPEERQVVERSLRTGALLEDCHFPIAKKLLVGYLREKEACEDTLVVLNGLPRHVGQAKALEPLVEIRMLVSLECGAETAWQRICLNSGGDREKRADDSLEKVARRLRLFADRTAPMLEHYRTLGVPVLPLEVGVASSAQEFRSQVEARWSEARR